MINIGCERLRPSASPAPTCRPGPAAGGDAAVRESLLGTCRDLLLQHGFGNVSTRQIAAAAGTTPAMIHYYFCDKRGLYRAIIESAVQPLIDSVRRLEPAAGSGSGEEAPGLEAVMRAYMRMVAANPWFPALILREVLDQNGRMRGEFIERFAAKTAPALVAVLRRERERGKLRVDIDPRFARLDMTRLVPARTGRAAARRRLRAGAAGRGARHRRARPAGNHCRVERANRRNRRA
ncbi:MAG: TetR/AcrR family transcriptional regulator [Proteobacteria bacterium]|nr:TetR/AcrR family transcriptional regulator [Pseudomonadota bacterium]